MLPIAILAGGMATRMRPLTEKTPKALLPLAGRPFLHWQLELLRKNGFSRVVICAGHLGDQIRLSLARLRIDMEIEFSDDGGSPLGTGGAIKKAIPLLGRQFMVTYGDSWLEADFAACANAFARSGLPGLMAVFENNGHWDKSNAMLEADRIVFYSKTDERPGMRYIDYGLGCFSADVFKGWPDVFDLADLYSALSRAGRLAAWEADRRFYEIGSPAGYAELQARFSTHGAVCD